MLVTGLMLYRRELAAVINNPEKSAWWKKYVATSWCVDGSPSEADRVYGQKRVDELVLYVRGLDAAIRMLDPEAA